MDSTNLEGEDQHLATPVSNFILLYLEHRPRGIFPASEKRGHSALYGDQGWHMLPS